MEGIGRKKKEEKKGNEGNGRKWTEMAVNGRKWKGMKGNGAKWWEMEENGRRRKKS